MQHEDPQQAGQEAVPAYSWYALAVLFVVYLVNFIDRQILSILANDIKADLGLTDADLGFLYGTAFALFYALFGIPLGRLADQWNRTKLLALGLSLWSAMTMLSGFARSGVTLALARIGVGVGEATSSPCAYSLIGEWFPAHRRALALSIYTAGLFLGSGLSLLLGGMIVDVWKAAYPVNPPLGLAGWQAAFIAVGAPGLLLALVVIRLKEPGRAAQGAAASGAEQLDNPWGVFLGQVAQIVPPFTLIGAFRRGPQALFFNAVMGLALLGAAWAASTLPLVGGQAYLIAGGLYAVASWGANLRVEDRPTYELTLGSTAFVGTVLAYAAISYVGYTVTYWAAPYAERSFALTKAELGWALGAPAALGGFLGVIGGGWLADRLQQRYANGRLLVLLIGLLVPVPLVLVGYTTRDANIFLLCSFLLQVATPSALGAAGAASQALVLPHMRGRATALFFLGATLIGLAFGPLVAGYVSETTGSLGTGVMVNLLAVPLGLAALLVAIRYYPADYASRDSRALAAGPAFHATARPAARE